MTSRLDFESIATFKLHIVVLDNGFPQMTATSVVTIDVTDVNEAPYDVTINVTAVDEHTEEGLSDTETGSVIGRITILDPDNPLNPEKNNYSLQILRNPSFSTLDCFEVEERGRDETGKL